MKWFLCGTLADSLAAVQRCRRTFGYGIACFLAIPLTVAIAPLHSDEPTPPMVPPRQRRWPRGPLNDLQASAYRGSTAATITLLSRGSINIDQGDPSMTPLMYAAHGGHSPVARLLLSRGANVATAIDDGTTALHLSTCGGHQAVRPALTCTPDPLMVPRRFFGPSK